MRKDISNRSARRLATGLVLLTLASTAGCATVGYYSQAINGQLAVTFARRPVTQLLTDPSTAPGLKQRLELTQSMLTYIEQTLGLSAKGRYRAYVALDDDAVVFNLVATPRLSVTAHQWCYPIVGCAPYRGYFKRAKALAAAARYAKRGYTTYVGAVPAYSTLGWFKDPLLSSFVNWPDAELMALLSHELAHSRVWVDSDVAFNEAFASFVGEQSARNWLSDERPEQLAAYRARNHAWQQLVGLQMALKSSLSALYNRSMSDAAKQQESERRYADFRACYERNRARLGAGRYDAYVSSLNDAALAALATYRDDVPAFAALYAEQQGNWASFFDEVARLAALPSTERGSELRTLSQKQVAQARDNERAEQVECQTLADHGVDRDEA